MRDDLDYIYISDTYVRLDTDGRNVVPRLADELRVEYEGFRVGEDDISRRMRILYNILGSIVFKCVAQRDANFRRNCREFRNLDIGNLNEADVIPELRIFEYDHDV